MPERVKGAITRQRVRTAQIFQTPECTFILHEKVAVELQRLESLGVVSPVKVSKWATPIVPILKKNGTVHVCRDYKVSANKALLTEEYPLPKVDDLVSALSGGKLFTKLDMSNAYLQLYR